MRCELFGHRKAKSDRAWNAERAKVVGKRCLRAGINTVYGDSPGSA